MLRPGHAGSHFPRLRRRSARAQTPSSFSVAAWRSRLAALWSLVFSLAAHHSDDRIRGCRCSRGGIGDWQKRPLQLPVDWVWSVASTLFGSVVCNRRWFRSNVHPIHLKNLETQGNWLPVLIPEPPEVKIATLVPLASLTQTFSGGQPKQELHIHHLLFDLVTWLPHSRV